MKYREYITSDKWKLRKSVWIKKHGNFCVCGRLGVNLHHMSYGLLGREGDRHLVLLCRKCHVLVHKIYKLKFGNKIKLKNMKHVVKYLLLKK